MQQCKNYLGNFWISWRYLQKTGRENLDFSFCDRLPRRFAQLPKAHEILNTSVKRKFKKSLHQAPKIVHQSLKNHSGIVGNTRFLQRVWTRVRTALKGAGGSGLAVGG